MAIENKKYMEHGKYQGKTRAMTNEQLNFTILDARDAISANPKGVNNDYYADEINYCSMELFRRRKQGKISDIDWRRFR
tara:strand:- start:214 stop:450 length:237 start_codon:yes stop_codon:yes gene_type:complete